MVMTSLTTTTSLTMCNHYALSNPVAPLQAPAPEQISQGSALHGTGVPSNTLTACRLACTQLYHFMLTYVCSCHTSQNPFSLFYLTFPRFPGNFFCGAGACKPCASLSQSPAKLWTWIFKLGCLYAEGLLFVPPGGFGSQEAAKTRSPLMCDKSCVEYPVWLWLWQDSCSYCHLCPEGNLRVQHYCSAKVANVHCCHSWQQRTVLLEASLLRSRWTKSQKESQGRQWKILNACCADLPRWTWHKVFSKGKVEICVDCFVNPLCKVAMMRLGVITPKTVTCQNCIRSDKFSVDTPSFCCFIKAENPETVLNLSSLLSSWHAYHNAHDWRLM